MKKYKSTFSKAVCATSVPEMKLRYATVLTNYDPAVELVRNLVAHGDAREGK